MRHFTQLKPSHKKLRGHVRLCRAGSSGQARRLWGAESLEPRLVLSFTEIPAGDLFPGLSTANPSWGDYNNDGWVDAIVDGGNLYQNNGGASFSHVTDLGAGGLWGDFNNDGWLDIHGSQGGCCPTFSINQGGTGEFSRFEVGNFGHTNSQGSALGDFNSDGWLDVYIGGFEQWSRNLDYADRLVLNVPDVTKPGGRGFEVIDELSYLRARGVAAADFNEDGHSDVYVSNYRLQGNLLWINDGSGSNVPFIFGSDSHNARGGDGHSIGSAFGDLDSDGHIDIFVGNFAHGGQPESRVLLNQGPAGNYHFSDLGQRGIYYKESWSSPALADFDNDGMLDVFFTALQYYGNHSELFRNTGSPGNPQFAEVTAAEGLPSNLDLFRVNWVDWDNDGDLDLATNGRLFRNDLSNGNSWLKVDLLALGIEGVNTFGFGATVRIDTGDKIVTRHVEAGQGQGNQNELTLHFGLGHTPGPVDVEVVWPGGTTRTIQTEVNQSIEIHYGSMPKNDFFDVDEDNVLSVEAANGLLSNDLFLPGGPSLTAELVDLPDNGQVVIYPDGSFQYTPDHNWFGDDTFTYRLVGEPEATEVANVTISVASVSDPPVAVDDFIVVQENQVYSTGDPLETVVSFGSEWKYLDTGVDQKTAWRNATFDDSAWPTGVAQLGYGDGDEVTVVSFGPDENSKFRTTYFRHAFEVNDSDRITHLLVNLVRDDGAAVYLNGQEIVRDNLVANPIFNTFATTPVSGAENEPLPFNVFGIPDGMIVNGTNVLAAEIHQADLTSSDISFDLELIVERMVDLGVLDNDFDPDGEAMIAELLSVPQHGTVAMSSNGQFSYTPDAGFTGDDSFSYRTYDVRANKPTTFVELGSSWRYLDDGSNQGTAWVAPGYNDAAWSVGLAELGYGDGDEVTEISYGPDAVTKYATTYFRTDFEIATLGEADFTASLLRDDAAVVYLNGVEVFRDSNLPSDAGYDDYTVLPIGDDESTPVSFTIPVNLGIVGQNTLAVEVHQHNGTSSDLSFDFELRGVVALTSGWDEGLVNITVEEVNDLPVPVDDQYFAMTSQTLVVDAPAGVLSNDTDDEDDPLIAAVVTPPTHGDLLLASDGSFSYTPNAGYQGQDKFVYRAFDDNGTGLPDLILQGSNWRYLDDGSDQGTAWRATDFDDSTWRVGQAEFGYGDGDEQTEIDFGGDETNKHVTTYFRYEFQVAVAERFDSLSAWLVRDDGAAVYFNGAEVFRDNVLPVDAAYDTYTIGTEGENATLTYSIVPDLLVKGINVVAVEVHQQAADSSDLSFDFRLTAEVLVSTTATVTIDVSSTPSVPGDVNLDGHVDATDIDDLYAAIGLDTSDLRYDVDESGGVGPEDVDYLVTILLNVTPGDTDLDGDVDTRDLTRTIIGFTGAGGMGKGWADGDTDGDGDIDTGDVTTAIIRFTGAH